MKLILNEQSILNESLKNGYIDDKKPSNTIRLLAKHYFFVGMSKNQVIDSIDKFFSANFKNYNTVKWQKTIENIVKSIHRDKSFEMLNIKSINITKNELNAIQSLRNQRLERLAFTLLVYAKIYNLINKTDSNWMNSELKYVFSDAKVAVKINEQPLMIHKLSDLGMVESSRKVDCTNIKVNFVDENSEVMITISDFRNFVYEYLRYCGEDICKCEGVNCGVLIRQTSNRRKYCSDCWKEKEKILWKENKRKNRSVQV